MNEENEKFLSRWSRLKQEAKEQQAQSQPAQPPVDLKSPLPDLPPVEELTFESDFRAFFHPKVGENLRRSALKRLFSDPHFNVMDGLDVYIEDYSKSNPLPAAMLAQLRQAQKILDWAKEAKEEGPGRPLVHSGAVPALDPQSPRLPPAATAIPPDEHQVRLEGAEKEVPPCDQKA